MKYGISILILLASCVALRAADEVSVKYRVNGMFMPERAGDLKNAAAKTTDIKLTSVDYEKAEAIFSYDSTKVLKGAKPDQVRNHIENLIKQASNHTFSLAEPIENRDKLAKVELHVGLLDCKACALGVYGMVKGVAGVEQVTVGLKDGLVTAWIDSAKTDRSKIVELLKNREVHVKDP